MKQMPFDLLIHIVVTTYLGLLMRKPGHAIHSRPLIGGNDQPRAPLADQPEHPCSRLQQSGYHESIERLRGPRHGPTEEHVITGKV